MEETEVVWPFLCEVMRDESKKKYGREMSLFFALEGRCGTPALPLSLEEFNQLTSHHQLINSRDCTATSKKQVNSRTSLNSE